MDFINSLTIQEYFALIPTYTHLWLMESEQANLID